MRLAAKSWQPSRNGTMIRCRPRRCQSSPMSKIVCRPRVLSPDQAAKVLRRSIEINPANADEQRVLARTPVGRRGGQRRLAVLIGHKWPETGVRLTVQFLDNPSRDLRARILLHMNAWSKTTNVQFVETASVGQVRIARLDAPEELWRGTGRMSARRSSASKRTSRPSTSKASRCARPRQSSGAWFVMKPATRWASSTNTCARI